MHRPGSRPEHTAAGSPGGRPQEGPWDRSGLPAWFQPLVSRLDGIRAAQLAQQVPGGLGGRRSAVLVLFGEGPQGPDVLLIRRADNLRSHAGQPAFPGGSLDPEDRGPVDAALREAWEETGLDRDGVQVVGILPEQLVSVSGFVVTPVIGWWRTPSPVTARSPLEVALVRRVPLAELIAPENRLRVRYPVSRYIGPAFQLEGMVVWGFTAGVLDRIIRVAGWEQPWDTTRVEDLPTRTPAREVAAPDGAGAAGFAPSSHPAAG